MDKFKGITNSDLIESTTTASVISTDKELKSPESLNGTGSKIPDEEKEVGEEIKDSSTRNYSPKPVEIAQKQYYESQKVLNESKARWWDRFKIIMTITSIFIGFVLTFLGIFWAYKLNNLAEPIGGIKAEMQFIKDDNKDIKDHIQRNETRLNELIDKMLDRNLTK